MTGTIVRLLAEKRFGFIKGEDGLEYFFHSSDFNGFFEDLAKDVLVGRPIEVEFSTVQSNKGPRAAEVTRIDGGV